MDVPPACQEHISSGRVARHLSLTLRSRPIPKNVQAREAH
jgi:hypothetical protein